MTTRTTDKLSDHDLHRFARQLILNGFGEDHQLALLSSHVVVIGAGGLGAPLLQYLAAAGIGKLTIFDDDRVELTNLNRQVIHHHGDLGILKTKSAQEKLVQLDPAIKINLRAERFEESDDRISQLDGITVICDTSDNPETRYAANNVAHRAGLPLVFGGAVRMEGQVAVFRSGIDSNAPCYQCVFPSAAGPDLAPGCAEAGILGAVTGVIGSIAAMETIRQSLIQQDVSNPIGPGLGYDLMLFDGSLMTMDRITMKKSPECPCCGNLQG
jgi:adenylyltransferase/sulfurtransferase